MVCVTDVFKSQSEEEIKLTVTEIFAELFSKAFSVKDE